MERIAKKICLMGLSGKTAGMGGIEEWLKGDSSLSTLGVKIFCKTVELEAHHLSNKRVLQLIIWSLKLGFFHRLTASYLRGASGAIVMVDTPSEETLESLSEAKNLFFSVNPNALLIVVFNPLEVKNAKPVQDMLASGWENPTCTFFFIDPENPSRSINELLQNIAYKIIESA